MLQYSHKLALYGRSRMCFTAMWGRERRKRDAVNWDIGSAVNEHTSRSWSTRIIVVAALSCSRITKIDLVKLTKRSTIFSSKVSSTPVNIRFHIQHTPVTLNVSTTFGMKYLPKRLYFVWKVRPLKKFLRYFHNARIIIEWGLSQSKNKCATNVSRTTNDKIHSAEKRGMAMARRGEEKTKTFQTI